MKNLLQVTSFWLKKKTLENNVGDLTKMEFHCNGTGLKKAINFSIHKWQQQPTPPTTITQTNTMY